jgi:aspartate kinase
MEIYKFGGISIKDAESVKKVSRIIQDEQAVCRLLVFSAMGKMTRHLVLTIDAFFYFEEHRQNLLNDFQAYHQRIIEDLEISAQGREGIKNLFDDLYLVISGTAKDDYDFFYDQLICFGELLSSKIMSLYLDKIGIQNTWIDIRELFICNNNFRRAEIKTEKSLPLIKDFIQAHDKESIIVTQGFIARSEDGNSTSLGFEGSDYSAAFLANALDANKLTIWKDVDGIMNADPKVFPDAVKIDQLSYEEAFELSNMGAKIIHPKTIKPLQSKNIPLVVRPFQYPEKPGTLVSDQAAKCNTPLVVVQKEVQMIRLSSKNGACPDLETEPLISLLEQQGQEFNMLHKHSASLYLILQGKNKIGDLVCILSNDYHVAPQEKLELVSILTPNKKIIKKLSLDRDIVLEGQYKKRHFILSKNNKEI